MGADDILRVIHSQGGGIEVRFAIGKLSKLSVAVRQDLAKRMAEDRQTVPAAEEETVTKSA